MDNVIITNTNIASNDDPIPSTMYAVEIDGYGIEDVFLTKKAAEDYILEYYCNSVINRLSPMRNRDGSYYSVAEQIHDDVDNLRNNGYIEDTAWVMELNVHK